MEEKKEMTFKEKASETWWNLKTKMKYKFDSAFDWISEHKYEIIVITPIAVKCLDVVGRSITASSRNRNTTAKYGNCNYNGGIKCTGPDGKEYYFYTTRMLSEREMKKLNAMLDAGYLPQEALRELGVLR